MLRLRFTFMVLLPPTWCGWEVMRSLPTSRWKNQLSSSAAISRSPISDIPSIRTLLNSESTDQLGINEDKNVSSHAAARLSNSLHSVLSIPSTGKRAPRHGIAMSHRPVIHCQVSLTIHYGAL